jgi:hypothetical protein
VARLHRIRASRTTVEIVSWTIGILLMAGLTLLAVTIAHHFGWSWP